MFVNQYCKEAGLKVGCLAGFWLHHVIITSVHMCYPESGTRSTGRSKTICTETIIFYRCIAG